ncbi:MAG: helix-hairpin-helix domain-containing protein [Bacteriovoracaceae bacterium]|nr:helix-hairpin-helix domain-containing protein [Bacteriovoracaceae bacterium]
MSLDPKALIYATQKLELPAAKVMATATLLYTEQCTVPFIARYRKEVTGNLDEVQIRGVQEFYEEYIEIEKRRVFILDAITKMEAMTPALEKQIKLASTLNQLEDLYAPYKSKKKTKAMIAKELGLEPVAELIMKGKGNLESHTKALEEIVAKSAGKLKDINEALAGASDIIIETISHDLELKEKLRHEFWKAGLVKTIKRKDADTIEEAQKFRDFFEFSEPLSKIKEPKASHRYLALRRGMMLKVLKVDVEIEPMLAYGMIEEQFFPQKNSLGCYEHLKKCAQKAYDQVMQPSLDLEIKNDLKKIADTAAINIFGVNLKDLLLQPYLGSKAVLGIDPGVRTGCKVVVIDATGKFIGDHVIYPFAPKNDVKGSATIITKMIDAFSIEYICVGSGTYGRETLEFLEENVPQVKDGKTKATLISESGASIYSASDIAREEFPDKDVTVRGAISIARRFQDPLAELVKIDAKSIGVGQYQHDVNQVQLKNSLEGVVESCVNYVGVDLNTASAPLLSFVSGIGPTVAKNIVKFRQEKGAFSSRDELLKVPRFSQKVFEQCAGFLRLYNSSNPLDATFIHPERYPLLENWAKKKNKKIEDLVADKELQNALEKDPELKKEMGEMTLTDIVKSLRAPTQDPRTAFKSVEFAKGIKDLKDLKEGDWHQGVVTNITMFGAFVDIGIKENGLLHISQISDTFVENATDKLKVGQELKVKVIGIDHDRKRVSLSCKADSKSSDAPVSTSQPMNRNQKMPAQPAFKNNAFAGLSGLKVK